MTMTTEGVGKWQKGSQATSSLEASFQIPEEIFTLNTEDCAQKDNSQQKHLSHVPSAMKQPHRQDFLLHSCPYLDFDLDPPSELLGLPRELMQREKYGSNGLMSRI